MSGKLWDFIVYFNTTKIWYIRIINIISDEWNCGEWNLYVKDVTLWMLTNKKQKYIQFLID